MGRCIFGFVLLAMAISGCGGEAKPGAQGRFVLVHQEEVSVPGSDLEQRLFVLKDTRTGTCLLANSYGRNGGITVVPKEVCQ